MSRRPQEPRKWLEPITLTWDQYQRAVAPPERIGPRIGAGSVFYCPNCGSLMVGKNTCAIRCTACHYKSDCSNLYELGEVR